MNIQTVQFADKAQFMNNSTSTHRAIPAKTSDGLSVFISLKVYFKINPNLEDVAYIYKNYTKVRNILYIRISITFT